MRNARLLRQRAGKTLKAVEAETGVGFTLLSKFELGQLGMRIDTLLLLARYYGVSIEELVQEMEPAAAK